MEAVLQFASNAYCSRRRDGEAPAQKHVLRLFQDEFHRPPLLTAAQVGVQAIDMHIDMVQRAGKTKGPQALPMHKTSAANCSYLPLPAGEVGQPALKNAYPGQVKGKEGKQRHHQPVADKAQAPQLGLAHHVFVGDQKHHKAQHHRQHQAV